MSQTASAIVQKVWNYAHVMRDDGLSFLDYTEQITYLLFLKLAWEQRGDRVDCGIPSKYSWEKLKAIPNNAKLAQRYQQALKSLSKESGLLGLIFTKPQSKINDPAKLRRLIEMIDGEEWSKLDFD